MHGLDLSFSAPAVTSDWCARRIAEGYTVLCVNLWAGGSAVQGAEQALRTWREAGGLTAAYFVVHDYRPALEHFLRARANAGAEWEHLRFVAVDAERIEEVEQELGYTVTTETILNAVALVEGAGFRACIYTGKWFWAGPFPPFMGNPSNCAHIPVWYADYDGEAEIGNPGCGGWASAVGKQYTDSTDLEGIMVDYDVFADSLVGGDMATPEQEAAVRNAIAFAKANADSRLVALVEAQERLYGKDNPFASELRTVRTELNNEVVKKLGDAFPL